MRIWSVILAMAACPCAAWAQIASIVVTSAASYERGMPWRGSIASVFCTGLRGINGIVTADRYPLPLELVGVQVTIGRTRAPLFAIAELGGYQQINLQVPWEAEGERGLIIEQAGERGGVIVASILSPGAFFRLSDGNGAFQHADYGVVNTGNPARVGEVIIGYLTGLVVRTTPAVPTGQPSPADPPAVVSQELGLGRLRFEIWMGEPPNQKVAVPLFLGLAPGLAGVYQVNFTVPDGLGIGVQPVRLVQNDCVRPMFGNGCVAVYPAEFSLPVPMAVQ
jgi:uncharacterized protein (TIGR03437 family)